MRPAACVEKPGTLRGKGKYWPADLPFDENFHRDSPLEWLVSDPADIVLTGLMFREFGPPADPQVYGQLVCDVHADGRGPEYVWTDLLAKDMRTRLSGQRW